MIRYIIVGIAILAIIPIAWLAWWLLSPLWMDTEVSEEFPRAARAVIPEGMTHQEVEVQMGVAAATDDPMVEEAMPDMSAMAASEVATAVKAAGNFMGADSFHQGMGTATIFELGPGERVLRFEDFRVTNGPDLRVLLVNAPNPEGHGDLDDAGYVELGKLKGNVGSQNYDIPADLPLSEAQSVVIYCKPFRVVFSVASLAQVGG